MPNIILCAEKKWLLTTTDKNLVLEHRDLLLERQQSVVFTSNNSEKFDTWLDAFTVAKAAIERNWKKNEPPWVARLHPNGFLEVAALKKYSEYEKEKVRKKGKRRRRRS